MFPFFLLGSKQPIVNNYALFLWELPKGLPPALFIEPEEGFSILYVPKLMALLVAHLPFIERPVDTLFRTFIEIPILIEFDPRFRAVRVLPPITGEDKKFFVPLPEPVYVEGINSSTLFPNPVHLGGDEWDSSSYHLPKDKEWYKLLKKYARSSRRTVLEFALLARIYPYSLPETGVNFKRLPPDLVKLAVTKCIYKLRCSGGSYEKFRFV